MLLHDTVHQTSWGEAAATGGDVQSAPAADSPKDVWWTVSHNWKGQESLTKVAKFDQFPCTILYKSCLFYPSWQATSFERPPYWVAFIEGFHCTKFNQYLPVVLTSLNLSDSRFWKLVMFWMWHHHDVTLWRHGGGAWCNDLLQKTASNINSWAAIAKHVIRLWQVGDTKNFERWITG